MKEIIKELNVEKLNICEKDGTVKMSLFNSENIPPLWIDNKDILPGHRQNDGISGIMFYNNEGDECGGLIYGSNVDKEGNISSGLSLTMDKYKQDQLVQMDLQEYNKQRKYGFTIYDRPNCKIQESLEVLKKYNNEDNKEKKVKYLKELQKDNHKRLFVGHDLDGETKIALYNKEGTEKVKLFIDNDGDAKLIINGKQIDLNKL